MAEKIIIKKRRHEEERIIQSKQDEKELFCLLVGALSQSTKRGNQTINISLVDKISKIYESDFVVAVGGGGGGVSFKSVHDQSLRRRR